MDLSIIIPCRDEANNLKNLIPRLYSEMASLYKINYEIIVLNHGSIDNTKEIVEKMNFPEHNLKCIDYPRNGIGLGKMLIDGIEKAHGSYIITMDGDLSHDPSMIKYFLELRKSSDLSIGVRYNKGQGFFYPKLRFYLSKTFNLLPRLFINWNITDYTSGYRGFEKKLFSQIKMGLKAKGFEIHLELNGKLLKVAKKPSTIQITYLKRGFGKSKLKYHLVFFNYLKIFFNLLIFPKSII